MLIQHFPRSIEFVHPTGRSQRSTAARDEFFAPLSPREREQFFRMLKRLVERPT